MYVSCLTQESGLEIEGEDDLGVEGEQGESEPGVSDANVSDLDDADDKTVAAAQMKMNPPLRQAPTLSTGTAGLQAPQAAKKKAKKPAPSAKEQIAEAEQENQDEDGVEKEARANEDLPEYIQRDTVLSKAALRLKKVYPCFASLVPHKNLETRKPIGHQLRGDRVLILILVLSASVTRVCQCPHLHPLYYDY